MANVLAKSAPAKTVADLLARLGNIPPRRVRLIPVPGTATEKDVIEVEASEDRLCELVEGTLVEKVMGFEESELAASVIFFLSAFVRPRKLGIVTGPDGTIRLMPGLVRIPDIAFLSRARFPGGKRPKEAIPHLAPDLVVEVLSKGNTKKEMRRKLREYFDAGVPLIWYVDAKTHTVQVFTAVDRSVTLREDQTLDGGNVLPGFRLPLSQLFAEPDE
ncbi:MAG: Uma2 family endonuclease [Isosphaeraceae bacterium]|nr:Uma2 family endonuclease [Isosphaeraceae bacterium]